MAARASSTQDDRSVGWVGKVVVVEPTLDASFLSLTAFATEWSGRKNDPRHNSLTHSWFEKISSAHDRASESRSSMDRLKASSLEAVGVASWVSSASLSAEMASSLSCTRAANSTMHRYLAAIMYATRKRRCEQPGSPLASGYFYQREERSKVGGFFMIRND